jgi:hypothetical protein
MSRNNLSSKHKKNIRWLLSSKHFSLLWCSAYSIQPHIPQISGPNLNTVTTDLLCLWLS